MTIAHLLARLVRDKRGLAATEYAFLCGLIVIVMITTLNSLANVINLTWNNVATQSQSAVAQATGG